MSVTFAAPGMTIEIKNPEHGNEEENTFPSVIGKSASGKPYRYGKGYQFKTLNLQFRNLRQKEKEELNDFFEHVDGPITDFTYTDHQGNSETAFFAQDRINFAQIFDCLDAEDTFSIDGVTFATTSTQGGFYNVDVKLELIL